MVTISYTLLSKRPALSSSLHPVTLTSQVPIGMALMVVRTGPPPGPLRLSVVGGTICSRVTESRMSTVMLLVSGYITAGCTSWGEGGEVH